MAMTKRTTGAFVAAAAAGLLLAGCANSGGTKMASADVHCSGVNSCKGQTSCKSAKNDCKGQNSCKGKGWLGMSKEDCSEKSGTVL